MDDEFAKDVSEFDTLPDFRKDLADKLRERRQTQAQRDFEEAIMTQVMDNMEVEIPDAMVDFRAEQLVNDMAQRIQAQGIPFEQYLAMTGMNMDIMREQAKTAALERVRRELALSAVAAAEALEITDEELDAEYKRLAEQYKVSEEEAKTNLSADDVRKELLDRKAERVILDSAKQGKPAAKKKAAKKTAKKAEEEEPAGGDEEKPKKTTARKKTAKKAEEEEASADEGKAEE